MGRGKRKERRTSRGCEKHQKAFVLSIEVIEDLNGGFVNRRKSGYNERDFVTFALPPPPVDRLLVDEPK